MIWAGIGSALVTFAVLLAICGGHLGIGFSLESAKSLYYYSSRITMIALVQVAGHISQPLLMAKALGAIPVGLFSTSLRLVSLPIEGVTTALRAVLFPVFSSTNNRADLRGRFLKSYFLMANVIVVWCCFVFAASDELVLLLLGEPWRGATPIVRILAFGCAFAYMGSILSTLIDSTLNLHSKLMVDLCYLLLLLGSIAMLYRQGTLAVISAYAGLEVLRWALYGMISLPSLGVKASRWIAMHLESWPLLAAFTIMLLCRGGIAAASPAARAFTVGLCGLTGIAAMGAMVVLRLGWLNCVKLLQSARKSPLDTGSILLDGLRRMTLAEV
jgi:O-antigen/teichoic acid export membrane protein